MTVETVCKSGSSERVNNGFVPNTLIPTARRHGELVNELSSPSSKKLTVYLNGVCGVGQEVTVEFDQLLDWNDFLLELDSGVTFSAPTNEVFSIAGEQLDSITAVMNHDCVVVSSGGDPFIPLQYKSLPTVHSNPLEGGLLLPKNVQLRKSSVGSTRKFMRSGLAKSVYTIDGPFHSSSSSTNELNSLLKTMSEEQVCFRETQTTRNHSQIPNSIVRQSVHPKPRPVSCYGAHSIYSSDVCGGVKKSPSSRIPKRIQALSSTQEVTVVSSASLSSVPQTPSSPLKVPVNNFKPFGPSPPKAEKIVNSKPSTTREKISRQELNSKRDFILPRIVSIIRTGTKPRKVIRYLLNQKSARSFEQVLSDMTERLQASWGAIRKVFTLSGISVETLEGFFKEERIFLACPSDRHVQDDFVLDPEEIKSIPNYSKLYPGAVKGKGDALQRTPQKRGKSPQVNERTLPSSYPTHPKYLAVSQLPNFILDKYLVGNIIGDGNFAVVRECIHRINGVQYALKVIDKTKSGLDAPADHEVKILKSLRHPNIVHLFEDYEYEDELFVIMEHVPGGDLFDTIAKCIKFSEEESASFTRDIASAIAFLHNRGIVHRDIKPENLLVYHEKDNKRRIKVGDFGLAHYIQDECLLYTVCGTPTYVAPEILAETGYSYRVDVWALGIILYILLCGYPPFASSTGEQADLFDLILVGDYEFPPEQWDGISEDAKDLIMKMIESEVDIRLSADDVLDHPWLCNNIEEAEAKRNTFFKNDFRFNVFEQMGLTKLGPCIMGSSSATASTSFQTTNSS